MVVIRNQLSSARAGGPRQYAQIRSKFMAKLASLKIAERVDNELKAINLTSKEFSSAPVVIVKPIDGIDKVIEEISFRENIENTKIRQALKETRETTDRFLDSSVATEEATRLILRQLENIDGVERADFITTKASFGPENLHLSLTEMETIPVDSATKEGGNLQETLERLNLPEVWKEERGGDAISCIFDTGFSEGLISDSRIIDTFHGDSVDSVFASAEGHGTMTAGAAAANSDEGVPFDGVAPDADVILVRITDKDGQINGEIIGDAWDWLAGKEYDKPVVANHSYGIPLCSGRPKARFCNDPLIELIERANSEKDITSVYAAGNEAMTCGHRLSGITNAITGHNSIESVVTVGALLTNGMEAQRYSSHGRGDCAPVADPKPNVSCAIPTKTYYGTEDGWAVKDMSTGRFGSSGGTSHASPMVAGMITLLQSKSMKERGEPMETEEIKDIIHKTAELPHANQINRLGLIAGPKGFDARFGFGQLRIEKAIKEV